MLKNSATHHGSAPEATIVQFAVKQAVCKFPWDKSLSEDGIDISEEVKDLNYKERFVLMNRLRRMAVMVKRTLKEMPGGFDARN